MNERIRQLAEQAKTSVPAGLLVNEWIDEYNRIFAELIVKECIRLCDEVDLAGADDCIDKIRDNFGVEE
jgi:hypothetical protein